MHLNLGIPDITIIIPSIIFSYITLQPLELGVILKLNSYHLAKGKKILGLIVIVGADL